MMRPRIVVTLPPVARVEAAVDFAEHARRQGAELVEVRTDLHPLDAWNPEPLHAVLPILVSVRTAADAPASWRAHAAHVDRPAGTRGHASLWSHHAATPLSSDDACTFWRNRCPPPDVIIKHVEPLGGPSGMARLLETQRRMRSVFGGDRVTVLATGADALPVRAVLSTQNALDYTALDNAWSAAPGQRLLADAVRSRRGSNLRGRLGILGHGIAHSRSPRVHRQPFDRMELPSDVDVAGMLSALHPHYAGLAVTSPFKRPAAAAVGAEARAINTLVRTLDGWRAYNTDVDGARHILTRFPPGRVTVLGDGGAADALKAAAHPELNVLRRSDIDDPVRGNIVWTWPGSVEPPAQLRFEDAVVGIIAYGPPAWRIVRSVCERGGIPLMLGPAWFVAQARAQRRLWTEAAW